MFSSGVALLAIRRYSTNVAIVSASISRHIS
jgi:hypothetical protein